MSEPIFMNQSDLAARWRIDIKTLRNWRCRNYGPPYIRIGRIRLYRLENIIAFETANDVETTMSVKKKG